MNRLNRDSNIELLRIILMFFILVIHANFLSIPMSCKGEGISQLEGISRFFFESLGICGVNCFIFISGWFGIKPSFKGFSNLIFQVLFFWCGAYLLFVLLGKSPLSLKGVEHAVLFTDWDWFIKAYIVLYFFAPVLNSFLETVSEKTCRFFIIIALLFQSTYGYLGGAFFYCGGYGPLSFFFLYILAGYLRRVMTQENYSIKGQTLLKRLSNYWAVLYFFLCCMLTLSGFAIWSVYGANFQEKVNALYYYVNPLIVLETVCLFIIFYNLPKWKSKTINYIAQSSFAVFLFHSEMNIRNVFNANVLSIYSSHNGWLCVFLIAGYLLIVYLVSIVIDQVRLLLWKGISKAKLLER